MSIGTQGRAILLTGRYAYRTDIVFLDSNGTSAEDPTPTATSATSSTKKRATKRIARVTIPTFNAISTTFSPMGNA